MKISLKNHDLSTKNVINVRCHGTDCLHRPVAHERRSVSTADFINLVAGTDQRARCNVAPKLMNQMPGDLLLTKQLQG